MLDASYHHIVVRAAAASGYVLKLNGSVTPTATSSIPVCNLNASEAPLVPHISTVNEDVTYTVYAYPTGLWRDFRVVPGRWQRGEKVFPLRVR